MAVAKRIGGHRRFDNICLRIFGADSVAVITYVYNNVAREALKVMRDSAQKRSRHPTYPFEKAVLKDSIAKSDAVLNLTIEKRHTRRHRPRTAADGLDARSHPGLLYHQR